ncbi:multi-sensor hybrid histidine kinase [Geitlerinema sp. PCC 7407]|nr:multi-sensor hybrid histidine kinase [Geitlerinema sp. PCC 7407]
MSRDFFSPPIWFRRTWIPYLALATALSLTFTVALYSARVTEAREQLRFESHVRRTKRDISARMDTYIALLRGTSGLFAASNDVSLRRFQAYINQLDLGRYYEGIQGIGFSQRVAPAEREGLVRRLRSEFASGLASDLASTFAITPAYERDEYHVIVYLEPLDERNRAALGYDMFTDKTRRFAMEQARDFGEPRASGIVTLMQEIDGNPQAGFLLYMPVYERSITPATVEARRAALRGFVYSPFRATDLFQGLFSDRQSYVDFRIYDGDAKNKAALLYQSSKEWDEGRAKRSKTETLMVAGRQWQLVFQPRPELDIASGRIFTTYVAISGVLGSLILFGVLRSQVKARLLAEKVASELQQSQTALEQSESRLRCLVEANIIGIITKEMNGRILEANDAFLRIAGYSREDVQAGRVNWLTITPPEYRDLDQQAIAALNTIGSHPPYEKEYIRKDGQRVPVLVGTARIDQGVGVSFLIDLSNQKLAEQSLQASEHRFRTVIEQSPLGMQILSPSGETLQVNHAWEQLWGLKLSDLAGYSLLQDPVLEGTGVLPYLERAFAGEAIALPAQQYDPHEAFPHVPERDIARPWVQIYAYPVLNEAQELQQVVLVHEDITERVQAEEALRQSEEHFRKLTEKVRAIPWESDVTMEQFSYVGPQSLEILGYAPEAWYIPGFWQDHLHSEDRGWVLERCTTQAKTQDFFELEYRIVGADDRTIWVYDTVSVLQDGDRRRVRGLMIDITERKQVESSREQLLRQEQAARAEAEATNRMKDEFLATLSHELRTPLNAIQGWTQMLRTRRLDETMTSRALETIHRNTRSLTQLIEDLLDVSRIITGKLSLTLYPLMITPVVEAAIESIRPAADAKNIEILTDFDPLTEPVRGDVNRLRQILWNLLSNAVKFTPQGGQIWIAITLERRQVCVHIRDTGQGISAEFLPFIFERFRQADSSITRSQSGLGLGLSIVRHLVELHGGTVQAESAGPNCGATFTVRLPLARPDRDPTPDNLGIEDSPAIAQPLQPFRILVVENDPDIRELLTTILEQAGAEVKAVADCAVALDLIEPFQPSAIISEMTGAEENGRGLVNWLKASDSSHSNIPAIALTAYDRAEDRTQALQAGFQQHVAKPVNPSELVTVVAELCRQWRKNHSQS